MIGSLTTLLRAQADQPGLLTVDVVTFDNQIDTIHVLADPRTLEVERDPRLDRVARAVGIGVTEFGSRLAAMPEHARPGTVLALVATDGEENASQQWTPPAIKWLLERQRTEYCWDFMFLGANQDAITTAPSRLRPRKRDRLRRGRPERPARDRLRKRVHLDEPVRRARLLQRAGPPQCLASPPVSGGGRKPMCPEVREPA